MFTALIVAVFPRLMPRLPVIVFDVWIAPGRWVASTQWAEAFSCDVAHDDCWPFLDRLGFIFLSSTAIWSLVVWLVIALLLNKWRS
jgi:hypothetical protein